MGLCSRSAAGTGYARQGDMETTPDLTVAERIRTSFGELTRAERDKLNGQIESLLQKGSFMDDELLADIRGALT